MQSDAAIRVQFNKAANKLQLIPQTAERTKIWVLNIIKPGCFQTSGCSAEETSLLFSPPLYCTPDPPQVQDYNKSLPPSIHLCSPAPVHSCTLVSSTWLILYKLKIHHDQKKLRL